MTASTVIAWKGPSAFDGSPVQVALTGLVDPSGNTKTGPMVQAYIIPDGPHPVLAQRAGADVGVCGDCPGRWTAERWCYVTPFPLLSIARSIREGKVPHLTDREALDAVAGRPLRMGAYGDPAALPYSWWWSLAKRASMWTGYTHAWRDCDWRFAEFTMASVEWAQDALAAQAKGWRTFRAKPPESRLLATEIMCPAQTKGTTCVECGLCNGQKGRSAANIAIDAHGPLATKFLQPRLL